MDRASATDRLRHLDADRAMRSMSARLEDLFQEVEEALEAGVSQAAILEEFRTFHGTLGRLRARRPETTSGMPLQQTPTRTRFVDTGDGAGPSTTVRGSLYDVEALSRLLLASAHSRL